MENFNSQFKAHWVSLKSKEKQALADKLDTGKSYLSQIAHGQRNAGKHFKKSIIAELGAMLKTITPQG